MALTQQQITYLENIALIAFGNDSSNLRIAYTTIASGTDFTTVITQLNSLLGPGQSIIAYASAIGAKQTEEAIVSDIVKLGLDGDLIQALSIIGYYDLPENQTLTGSVNQLSQSMSALNNTLYSTVIGGDLAAFSAQYSNTVGINSLDTTTLLDPNSTPATTLIEATNDLYAAVGDAPLTKLELLDIVTAASSSLSAQFAALNIALENAIGSTNFANTNLLGNSLTPSSVVSAINNINNAIGNSSINGSISGIIAHTEYDINLLKETLKSTNLGTLGISTAVAEIKDLLNHLVDKVGSTALTDVTLLGSTTLAQSSLSDESVALNIALQNAIGLNSLPSITLLNVITESSNNISDEFVIFANALESTIGQTVINIANGSLSGAIGSTALSSSISDSIIYLQNQIIDTNAVIENNGSPYAGIELLGKTTPGSTILGAEFTALTSAIATAIGQITLNIADGSISGAIGSTTLNSSISDSIVYLQNQIIDTNAVIENNGSSYAGIELLGKITPGSTILGAEFTALTGAIATAIGQITLNIADGSLSGAIGSTALSNSISDSIVYLQNQIIDTNSVIENNGSSYAGIELLGKITPGSTILGAEFANLTNAIEAAIGQITLNIADGSISGAIGSTTLSSSISDSIIYLQNQIIDTNAVIENNGSPYSGIELLGKTTPGSTILGAEFTALTSAIATAIGQTVINIADGSISGAIGSTTLSSSISDSIVYLQNQIIDTNAVIENNGSPYSGIELLGTPTLGSTILGAEFTALTGAIATAIGQTVINIADGSISGAIGSTALSSSISDSIVYLQNQIIDTNAVIENNGSPYSGIELLGKTTPGSTILGAEFIALTGAIATAIGQSTITGNSISAAILALQNEVGTTTDLLGINSSITAAIGSTPITGGTLSSSIATLQSKVGTTTTNILDNSAMTIINAIGTYSLPSGTTSLSQAVSEIASRVGTTSDLLGIGSYTVTQAIGVTPLVVTDQPLSTALSNLQTIVGIQSDQETVNLLGIEGTSVLNAIGGTTINGNSLSDAILSLQDQTEIASTGQPYWYESQGNTNGITANATYQTHAFYTCASTSDGIVNGFLVAGQTDIPITSAYLFTAYAQCLTWAYSAFNNSVLYGYMLDSQSGTCTVIDSGNGFTSISDASAICMWGIYH